jgi:hypothetical protein
MICVQSATKHACWITTEPCTEHPTSSPALPTIQLVRHGSRRLSARPLHPWIRATERRVFDVEGDSPPLPTDREGQPIVDDRFAFPLWVRTVWMRLDGSVPGALARREGCVTMERGAPWPGCWDAAMCPGKRAASRSMCLLQAPPRAHRRDEDLVGHEGLQSSQACPLSAQRCPRDPPLLPLSSPVSEAVLGP